MADSYPNDIQTLCICKKENKIWEITNNTCNCAPKSYLSNGACYLCPKNADVNAAKNGCDCKGVSTVWMPDCNTCECILTAYNQSGIQPTCIVCPIGSKPNIP